MRFLLGFLLLSSTVFGQKISDLPIYTGYGDSAYVLTVVNGANRKMYGKDMSKLRLDSLTNAINGKAATSHIHDISNITNLQSSLDAKQNASTAVTITGVQTLTNKTLTSPVINSPTGITKTDVGLGNVDNTSDVTKNSAVAILTNKTIDGGSNTLSNIPQASVSGLSSSLSSKQDALVSGTNIKTIDSVSVLGSGNLISEDANSFGRMIDLFGGSNFGETAGGSFRFMNNGQGLGSGSARVEAVIARKSGSVTGVRVGISVQGSFVTGANFNGVALYTYSGGTMTQVAKSTNNASLFSAAVGYLDIPFTTPYTVSKDALYIVMVLWTAGTVTTAPNLRGYGMGSSVLCAYPGFTNSAKMTGVIASQTDLLSSYTMTSVTNASGSVWVQLY